MIITQTPLRISLVGGGTDFKEFYRLDGGAVISTAIDKYIYVIVKERFDDKIVLSWTKKEIVQSVDEIQHELIREAMRKTGLRKGIEVITVADIPSEGSGLGSSSSLTVGLLNAFYAYQGELVSSERLAREACEIEIDILKKPIGKQDQYIAAYGNLRKFTFNKDGSVDAHKIELSEEARRILNMNLLLFYTNRTRSSAEILTEQRKNIPTVLETLARIRTQVTETEQVFREEDFDRVGQVLDEGWRLKKRLANSITDTDIEKMYRTAIEAGAFGGKIAGAGGGGFLLLYCIPEKQEKVRAALKGYREMPFRLERDGSKVILNMRRDTWKI
jgi:D-glycero-alpha-D-manno-heptose-7-phosphate kinase